MQNKYNAPQLNDNKAGRHEACERLGAASRTFVALQAGIEYQAYKYRGTTQSTNRTIRAVSERKSKLQI